MWIEPVSQSTEAAWAGQRLMLWPDEDERDLRDGAARHVAQANPDFHNLVALIDDDIVAGFAEASIRHDYVNGTSTSPVVFLEGIFVLAGYRQQGIAAALVDAVAAWGRSRGCSEFASDALIDNVDSHAFHEAAGFAEQECVVCFSKSL